MGVSLTDVDLDYHIRDKRTSCNSHEITSSGVRVRLICSWRELWGSGIHLNIIEFDKHIKVIQPVAIVYCIARIELIILSSAVFVCATEVPAHVTSALFTHVR